MLAENSRAIRMSVDHRCDTNEEEVERVESSKGRVIMDRVGGLLIVTWAFGDFSLKNKGVIATPTVWKHEVLPEDKYLIVASDGLWDVVSD